MLRNDLFWVSAVTLYLLIYSAFLQFEVTEDYAWMMWLFSPLVMGGLVYAVLKFGKYDGPELGSKEFGYQDKQT